MQYTTPLRYPGGKGRLAHFMGDVIDLNGLREGHYIEPFAGGAGIAISLLFLEYVRVIHLNDLNRSIFAFWHSVINEPEALCRKITNTKPTIWQWKRQKAIQNDSDASLLELGYSTFFLNRTNRSGIITAGVIGGLNQSGQWTIEARFNRSALTERIERIATYASRIKLYNLDAAKFIKDELPKISERALVYLDPPYYVKGARLYQNHYVHEDHVKIASLVQSSIRQHWLVSYDNVPEIKQIYRDRRQEEFDILYSAQTACTGSEVMIVDDDLVMPKRIVASRARAA